MAINMKNKKTSLDEGAYIYEQRHEDDISEKERFRKMNKQERRAHFFEYYSKPLIISIIIIGIVGYLIWHDFIARKNIIYRCAVMNETILTENLTEFNQDFTKFCQLDPKKNESAFNTYFTNELASQVGTTTVSDLQSIASQIYAGTLDGMIADELTFGNYLDNRFFTSMEDYLTTEEYEKLKPYLYVPEHKDNKKKKAYGIYLDQSPVYQKLIDDGNKNVKKPIFGILFNSKESERSRDVLYYLFPDILGERPKDTVNNQK